MYTYLSFELSILLIFSNFIYIYMTFIIFLTLFLLNVYVGWVEEIGFTLPSFSHGVGDCVKSWAFDSLRKQKLHYKKGVGNVTETYGTR